MHPRGVTAPTLRGCWLEREPVIDCRRSPPPYINVFSKGDISHVVDSRVHNFAGAHRAVPDL